MEEMIVLRNVSAGAWHFGTDRMFTTQLRAGERFSAVTEVKQVDELTTFLDAETGLFIFAEPSAVCQIPRSSDGDYPFGGSFGARN